MEFGRRLIEEVLGVVFVSKGVSPVTNDSAFFEPEIFYLSRGAVALEKKKLKWSNKLFVTKQLNPEGCRDVEFEDWVLGLGGIDCMAKSFQDMWNVR